MRQQVCVQWDPLNGLFQSNFAMGRSTSNQRTVYMLDFGLARQFLNQVREVEVDNCGQREGFDFLKFCWDVI